MKIECIAGEYHVFWVTKPKIFYEATAWCHEQFGPGWGSAAMPSTTDSGNDISEIVFKRLYHAQWFMMRWAVD